MLSEFKKVCESYRHPILWKLKTCVRESVKLSWVQFQRTGVTLPLPQTEFASQFGPNVFTYAEKKMNQPVKVWA